MQGWMMGYNKNMRKQVSRKMVRGLMTTKDKRSAPIFEATKWVVTSHSSGRENAGRSTPSVSPKLAKDEISQPRNTNFRISSDALLLKEHITEHAS